MKHTRLAILILAATGLGSLRADTVVMPPFTYTGRVMNYMRVAYPSGVTLYARNTNQVLLAKTTVFTSETSTRNYALPVPLASTPLDKMAVVGERLLFEVDDGTLLWADQSLMPKQTVGNPGTVAVADIVLQYDANGNGVADAYENLIETLRFEQDGVYAPYSPSADYDGDGLSNYQEYVAGTDPLSDAEAFTIDALQRLSPTIDIQSNRVAIRFYAMRGRTYSVVSADNLANPQWQPHTFRLSDSETDALMTVYYSPTDVEREGNVTFYLPVSAGARFYRLRVE